MLHAFEKIPCNLEYVRTFNKILYLCVSQGAAEVVEVKVGGLKKSYSLSPSLHYTMPVQTDIYIFYLFFGPPTLISGSFAPH